MPERYHSLFYPRQVWSASSVCWAAFPAAETRFTACRGRKASDDALLSDCSLPTSKGVSATSTTQQAGWAPPCLFPATPNSSVAQHPAMHNFLPDTPRPDQYTRLRDLHHAASRLGTTLPFPATPNFSAAHPLRHTQPCLHRTKVSRSLRVPTQ